MRQIEADQGAANGKQHGGDQGGGGHVFPAQYHVGKQAKDHAEQQGDDDDGDHDLKCQGHAGMEGNPVFRVDQQGLHGHVEQQGYQQYKAQGHHHGQ